ncbi:MAG TPA: M23 family metallopeptidase [bacterium]|nr:M23 family metallopeptidase [bacterium]HMW36812.1 M23 family metallopeptidase [bacterium]
MIDVVFIETELACITYHVFINLSAIMNSKKALIIVFVWVFGLSSCALFIDPYEAQYRQLLHERDSLQLSIARTRHDLKDLEAELWKTLYDTEYLRNALVLAQADSVKNFYYNYVFRYRRPIQAIAEIDPASPFLFPLKTEKDQNRIKFRIMWGRLFYFDFNHLGIDIRALEGDTVRAIYDGVIQNYGGAEGYGELVAVVEHEYRGLWNKDVVPQRFMSIYGHIRNRCYDGEPELKWKAGDRIRKGDIIGFINDDSRNGYGMEHLHLGIRRQSAMDAQAVDGGYWMRGYDTPKNSKFQFFMNPIDLFGRYVQFVLPE